jgi:hypothetical protein
MTVAAFDTLKLAQALREADFTPAQAEGAAEAIAAAIQSDLATKADLLLVKTELTASIPESEVRLRAAIADSEAKLRTANAESKAELLKWMFEAVGFQAVLIIGAVIALEHVIHP